MNIEDMSMEEIVSYINNKKRANYNNDMKKAENQCERIRNELVGKFFKQTDSLGETHYYYIADIPTIEVNVFGEIRFMPDRLPVLRISTDRIGSIIYPIIQEDTLYCSAGASVTPLNSIINYCGYTQITAQDFIEEYSRRLLMFFNQQKEN